MWVKKKDHLSLIKELNDLRAEVKQYKDKKTLENFLERRANEAKARELNTLNQLKLKEQELASVKGELALYQLRFYDLTRDYLYLKQLINDEKESEEIDDVKPVS